MITGMDSDIWNPVCLDKIGQIGMYRYVLVCTCTRRYKQVQDFAVWYKSVQVGTSQVQISWFWYSTVQVSTGFSELVQDGTRRYRSVQDFLYRYRTVQDGTSRYQISGTGTGTRRYKLVTELHSYYAYRTLQDSTTGSILYDGFLGSRPPIGHRWHVKKSWARAYHISAQGTSAKSSTIL